MRRKRTNLQNMFLLYLLSLINLYLLMFDLLSFAQLNIFLSAYEYCECELFGTNKVFLVHKKLIPIFITLIHSYFDVFIVPINHIVLFSMRNTALNT